MFWAFSRFGAFRDEEIKFIWILTDRLEMLLSSIANLSTFNVLIFQLQCSLCTDIFPSWQEFRLMKFTVYRHWAFSYFEIFRDEGIIFFFFWILTYSLEMLLFSTANLSTFNVLIFPLQCSLNMLESVSGWAWSSISCSCLWLPFFFFVWIICLCRI